MSNYDNFGLNCAESLLLSSRNYKEPTEELLKVYKKYYRCYLTNTMNDIETETLLRRYYDIMVILSPGQSVSNRTAVQCQDFASLVSHCTAAQLGGSV